MKKFVIIDGNNICFRSYYALPPLQNFEGVVSNAVFGFANTLVKTIEEMKPDYIAVAFDKGKKTFRHQKYAEYKAQRKPTPKELLDQLPLLKQMLSIMGIRYLELDDIEADDIIGVLSRKFDTSNVIVSADKDVLQLINDNTVVCAPQRNADAIVYDKAKLQQLMGIEPSQIKDLKGLMGDTSDNIIGVPGVGEKTAFDLLAKYHDLDGVYQNIDDIKGKLQEKLIAGKESAYFSKELATIVTDYNIDVSLDDFVYQFPFNANVLEFFKTYQFNSLIRKPQLFDLSAADKNIEEDKPLKWVDDTNYAESISNVNKSKTIYAYLDDEIFSVYDGEQEYNYNIQPDMTKTFYHIEDIMEQLRDHLNSVDVEYVLYDAKAYMHQMKPFGITIHKVARDISIAKYLVNSNVKVGSFRDTCNAFGLSETSYAYNLKLLQDKLDAKLKELDLERLYYEVELPLIPVLFDMEVAGIKIDRAELRDLEAKYSRAVSDLAMDIYDLAGGEFNINSPKQLAEVLFNKLGLKPKTDKKSGTGANVLNEIVGQHPIVNKILEYRQYFKLYSTYIRSYIDCMDGEDKVHTIFNQTQTATGRLSSTEPNLQNIPTRSEEGKILRKIFVPSTPNGVLISADYSQIELRLLANFSNDDKLIEAYNNGKDIHALTASEIFGVPINMVSDNMRRNAKAINFGIIYGISDWGLSQNIGITKKEAKAYIEKYFQRYPKVEEYMRANVEFAKVNGYISTLMGRIRFIPELKGNKMQQLFGERVAMNMPLQGSASDIIKLAMIRVADRFRQEKMKSRLILQIHDELVVDTVHGEEAAVKSILQDCMENVVSLKVRLNVNVGIGHNLADAKD